MSLFGLDRNQRKYRPKNSGTSWSKEAQLRKHVHATLGSGNSRGAVRLPAGEDLYECLAVDTVDFFNQVNLLFGTLTEFCPSKNCPRHYVGRRSRNLEVSAPKYVEYLMDWIESQLDDESIFPQKLGVHSYKEFARVGKEELAPLQELIDSILLPY